MSLYNDVMQICDESSPARFSGAFKSLGGHCKKDENLALSFKGQ